MFTFSHMSWNIVFIFYCIQGFIFPWLVMVYTRIYFTWHVLPYIVPKMTWFIKIYGPRIVCQTCCSPMTWKTHLSCPIECLTDRSSRDRYIVIYYTVWQIQRKDKIPCQRPIHAHFIFSKCLLLSLHWIMMEWFTPNMSYLHSMSADWVDCFKCSIWTGYGAYIFAMNLGREHSEWFYNRAEGLTMYL